jgi:hypothetical protein
MKAIIPSGKESIAIPPTHPIPNLIVVSGPRVTEEDPEGGIVHNWPKDLRLNIRRF